ncbi:MAG: flagellar hook-associated protein FlgK [Planctomycetes bacterium]|nr:flagellar hook-associated protein FlgK [Planctomycetota bacterium]
MPAIEALKIGSSALSAYRAAIETTGHNIANVATPGYSRQRVLFQARTPNHRVYGDIGRGSMVGAVESMASAFLDAQVRAASSENQRWEVLQRTFNALEGFLNELGDADLGDSLYSLFAVMNDVASDVESLPIRQQLLEQVGSLTDVFRSITSQLDAMWKRVDLEIQSQASRINTITAEIARLNSSIVQTEAGGSGISANDLRDDRGRLMQELSEIVAVSIQEDSRGGVIVSAMGRPLVYFGTAHQVAARRDSSTGGFKLVFAEDDADLAITGGELAGAVEARDEIIPEYRQWFDDFAASLIWQVNRMHSVGAGLVPRESMQGSNRVLDPSADLGSLTFDFQPRNGVFSIQDGRLAIDVIEQASGLVQRHVIDYDLSEPLAGSVSGLVERIDALVGVTAGVDNHGRVVLQAESGYGFYFSEDSGGILATLGLSGLFSGYDASTIALSPDLESHPEFIACAETLVPGDNSRILQLASLVTGAPFLDTSLSLEDAYQSLVGSLGSDSLAAQDAHQNQSDIVLSLQNERQEIAGVSLDEELANLIQYQRAYQGVAKFISIVDQLLNTLIEM